MDGVFWHDDVGFVVDPQMMAASFPTGVQIEPTSLDALLAETGKLPELGPAPLASWLLARMMCLTNERLGFETHAKLYHDGGGFYLNVIAFSRDLKPLAFFNVHGTSSACSLWGQCDRDFPPSNLQQIFISALVADADALVKCRLQCYDTDPLDLDKHRIGKPIVLGWDGQAFLG